MAPPLSLSSSAAPTTTTTTASGAGGPVEPSSEIIGLTVEEIIDKWKGSLEDNVKVCTLLVYSVCSCQSTSSHSFYHCARLLSSPGLQLVHEIPQGMGSRNSREEGAPGRAEQRSDRSVHGPERLGQGNRKHLVTAERIGHSAPKAG